MADACPSDNSTEAIICLLRQISGNTVSTYNVWDPLNFASTAAIGILALIVAGVTVFQGLLAAGPGRLKASSVAIGPFSVHSESHFDRAEYGLRTTARVPLITWDVVYHRIVRQKYQPDSEVVTARHDWRRSKDSESGRATSTEASRRSRPNGTTATWLNMLAALGLDDPQMFPLIERATDYLPADVQAAPAAADLRCLAILAVCADSGASISIQDRFFKVDADSSQLSFRDHPTLGQIAAYEAYEETAVMKVGDSEPVEFGSRFPMLTTAELDRCLQLAAGRLAYADGRITIPIDQEPDERGFMTLVRDLWKRSEGCGHDVCERAVEDWGRVVDDLQNHRRLKVYGPMKGLLTAVSLLAAERANLCRGFPKEKLLLNEALDQIMELSSFWREDFTIKNMVHLRQIVCATFWCVENTPWKDNCSASWVVDFQDVQSTVPNASAKTGRRSQFWKMDTIMQPMSSIRVWLQRKKNPAVAEFERNTLTAANVAQMLAMLDNWLLRKGGRVAACTMLKKMYQLGTAAHILSKSRGDGSGRSSVVIDDDLVVDAGVKKDDGRHLFRETVNGHVELKPQNPTEFTQDHISTLLIFRGVLMAIMLDMGADTTVLYQNNFRESIVKMI